MLDVIAHATGLDPSVFDRKLLLEGATERDIVYAGLDEVMSAATEEVIETAINRKVDFRTAAFINSLRKLDEFYSMSGFS